MFADTRTAAMMTLVLCGFLGGTAPLIAAESHGEHAEHTEHESHVAPASEQSGVRSPAVGTSDPVLPDGMSLDEVLDRAAQSPPTDWPPVIHDNAVFAYLRVEQMEWRIPDDSSDPHFGWEIGAWLGTDYHRLKLDSEGEWKLEDPQSGETELELRYSRLVSPFWSLEGGFRYQLEWEESEREDLISGVIVLSGVTPYLFEMNTTLALTEDADLSLEWEVEYDLRITQRLVLQPRIETALYAQDIPERGLYAGINEVEVDLRLRYELRRWFAPYVGVRSGYVVGSARGRGEDDEELMALFGVRWAW